MSSYRKIGVIGGMGPEATAVFYRQIIQLFQSERGARFNGEFPEMLIHNVPSPDNVGDLVDENLLPYLLNSLRLLENAGMDFAVMPCNSAHVHIEALKAAARIPVLDITLATANAVKDGGVSHVLVLGTRSTLTKGLYDRHLEAAAIPYTIPNRTHQDEITQIILRFCEGKADEETRGRLIEIIAGYPEADGVILGCTELPPLVSQEDTDRKLFNSSLILARAAYAFSVG